jgi:RecA/RadA recombinase
MAQDIKTKALDLALSQIEKQFGKGSMIMKLGEQAIEISLVIPTGSLGLDLALGVGGLPRGRVVEIYGPDSSGKTTLALECIAEAQKRGGVCAFIDAVTRARRQLRAQARRQRRGPPHLAAGQRRTGARNHGNTGAVGRDRRARDRFDRRAGATRRNQGEMGEPQMGCRRASCRRRCASSPR